MSENAYIFDRVASKYELINRLLSLGVNIYWRRHLIHLFNGMVLDIGTGSGEVLKLNRGKFGVGIDLSLAMLKEAKRRVENAEFVMGDAGSLPFKDGSFDTVIMSFCIRNIETKEIVIDEVRRVLKRGGKFILLEMTYPFFPILALYYRLYLRVGIPLLSFFLGMEREDYRYLGMSILKLGDGASILGLLKNKGFKILRLKRPFFGTSILLVGERL